MPCVFQKDPGPMAMSHLQTVECTELDTESTEDQLGEAET